MIDKNIDCIKSDLVIKKHTRIFLSGHFLKAINIYILLLKLIKMYDLLALRLLQLAILEKTLTTGCGQDIQVIFQCSGSMQVKTTACRIFS